MDAIKTVVNRYAVYLAVLLLGGPLLLLLLVYGADIFVGYMSYGLDKLHIEGFMIAVYLTAPLILGGLFLLLIFNFLERLFKNRNKKEKL
ncbi:hypothetical protein NYE71_32375 [Bacillus sp. FSL K6-0273]|uniref:hypothetical protein n=1 Tax=Bacillus TaxID=1386 RepID=UPI000BF79DC9|nr:hypothetical protein [Bacillus cereus]PFP85792.1 hypothetical protein COK08_24560 [Bacillus cereus]PGV06877.1 hypothetical protein COD81_15620 [Bacillus cereus]